MEETKQPEVLTDIFVDPRVAELETEVQRLNGELSAANSMIERLRIAKEGYKKVATQGANEVDYAWKIAPTVYFERRKREFREELNAVKDVE